MIKIAENDQEIADCFQTMKALRPDLAQADFVPLVRELMTYGYQLAYFRDEARDKAKVVCVAGFRISKNLFHGKNLYVDDLSTLDGARSKHYGRQILAWLRNLAIAQGCKAIHLDSGVQRHRAHKFYLNQNMDIVAHHFTEKLP